MKYVDDVLMGPPLALTETLIHRLNISMVVQGQSASGYPEGDEKDPYKIAKEMGIYKRIEVEDAMTTRDLI